jgi:hypothetical protein
MISWTSSSSRALGALAAAAWLASSGARAEAPERPEAEGGPAPVERPAAPAPAPASAGGSPLSGIGRVAIFPPESLAPGAGRDPGLAAAAAEIAARAGLEVVAGEQIEQFLAAERIRYTAGLDRLVARAAREKLGVDGVIFTTLESGGPQAPRVALTMRLVTTADVPEIVWMDGFARTGSDAPGLLGLGIVDDPQRLRREAFDALARSLARARSGARPDGGRCEPGRVYAPKFSFRLPPLSGRAERTVIVLPFLDSSGRRNAGEVVRLAVMRGLLAARGLHLVDPGEVRHVLLDYRIVLKGGVSLVSARTMLKTLRADWVVVGDVRRFDEERAAAELNLHVLDSGTEEIIWQSRSYNDGDDGVHFFGIGRVSTTSALVCRMVAEMVAEALPERLHDGGGGVRNAASR